VDGSARDWHSSADHDRAHCVKSPGFVVRQHKEATLEDLNRMTNQWVNKSAFWGGALGAFVVDLGFFILDKIFDFMR
jgi:hypothetical protein